MLECMILGDSIAVGTNMFYNECQLVGKNGINSSQFNNMYKVNDLTANTVVISLGTNDHFNVNTRKELLALRDRVKSKKVFWILPANNALGSGVSIEYIQNIVKDIAKQYNDVIIEIKSLQLDNIHPSWSGYRQIIKEIKDN